MDIDEELPQDKIDIDPVEFKNKIYSFNLFFIKVLSKDFQEIFNLKDIKKENSAIFYEAKLK